MGHTLCMVRRRKLLYAVIVVCRQEGSRLVVRLRVAF